MAEDDKRLTLPERANREVNRLLLDNDPAPRPRLLERRAATLLEILTQPAVPKSIRRLKAELGVVLFEHVGRRIKLTDAAVVLLRRRLVHAPLNGRDGLELQVDKWIQL